MMVEVYLSLGANKGKRTQNIKRAIRELAALPEVQIDTISSLYETAPIGISSQRWFLNIVLRLKTSLPPLTLLESLLDIEKKLGRVRGKKPGDRKIDIDILFYGSQILNFPSLKVPHPSLHQRRFVLEPLQELAPSFKHPQLKKKIKVLLEELDEKQEVIKKGAFNFL
jgi:2-amino-4-hydroxy-6-hydroxymethyldihydropteridine diphosphokinase